MSNRTNTFLGLVTGLVVGGAIGILFAPKSGKETREDLAEKGKDLVAKATKTKEELMAKLSEVSASEQERIKKSIAQLDEYIGSILGRDGNSKKA
jgi:gas vesicle protein